jgi:SHS2 domain-containing protein
VGEFQFVDDVALADCAVDLAGRDLDDLFETAAAALAALMIADASTLGSRADRTIALEAAALDLLLFDWLSELIFLKDRDGEVFPSCRARVTGDGPYRIDARATGGAIEPGRTALGADAKAVTLHQLAVTRTADGWSARVVIDI